MPEIFVEEFVNRDIEVNFMADMSKGQGRERVLLCSGKSGMGKSWLLGYFQHLYQKLPTAYINLEQASAQDPVAIVRELRKALPHLDWSAIDKLLAQGPNTYSYSVQGVNHLKLFETLNSRLDLEAFHAICFHLEEDHESLAGDAKPAKIRALLEKCRRAGRLRDLLDAIHAIRPDIALDEFKKAASRPAIVAPGAEDAQIKDDVIERLTDHLGKLLGTLTREAPILILLDDYDKATDVTKTWLSEKFLTKIRSEEIRGVLVVITGDPLPEFPREWRQVAKQTLLEPFPESVIEEYWLRRRKHPSSELAYAIKFSRGNPFTLRVIADNADEA